MSEKANAALVRRFYEQVWANGNLDVADEVFADDYERHDLRAGDPTPGPEGQKEIAAAFRAAVTASRASLREASAALARNLSF